MLLVLAFCADNTPAQKMTAEDILAKHLDSIGSAKSRASVKTRIIVSDVEFLRQKQNPITGKSVIASSNEGVVFGMTLKAVNYQGDKYSFDGKRIRVGYTQPGIRSSIGNFLTSYDTLLKDGLLGGTLSSSWALLDTAGRKSKLTYGGTEKIDDKETYVLEFQPKGGADITIKMYFDSKNFRHVRSIYSRVIGARIGSGGVDSSASQIETRHRVIEDFSDFKKYGGELTLPSSYKLSYSIIGGAATLNDAWTFKVTDVSFNQPLGDAAFDIDAN